MKHPRESDALLAQIVRLLRDMESPAYLVGGAVRDHLLRDYQIVGARAPHSYDLDFAVPGDGLRIARRVADALGAAFYGLDPERGVGRVVLTGDPARRRVVDVARFQGPDLAADLAGRDFTVNAMALDLAKDPPHLVDPHGGRADLQARRLRALSERAIRDDPVRGLRAVRQGAELNFEVEPRTQALIREAAPGLARVSAERIRDELVKILALPGVAGSLRFLDDLDLLAEILPELVALKGLAQSPPHRWDAYQHTMQAVAALETLLPLDDGPPHPDVPLPDRVAGHLASFVTGGQTRRCLLTLAAILHDVGKPETAASEPAGRVRFLDHERVGAGMAADIVRRLRFAADAARLVETVVRHHLRPLQLAWQGVAPGRRVTHRFFRAVGDAGVEVALLSLADHRATAGPDAAGEQYRGLLEVVRALLEAYFNHRGTVVAPPPVLTGHDLIEQFGLAEGPAIGRLLAALQEAQAAGQVATREQAEAWLQARIEERRSAN